uniref:uncharacterized protein LOC124049762 isoform X2 n=1 Tax=Scatophagus argus TaxID=75038 RepID=UPI001ED80BAE|nr:uncharacterized protein LOC124049762 isoform X2 [Scatophagus argus]
MCEVIGHLVFSVTPFSLLLFKASLCLLLLVEVGVGHHQQTSVCPSAKSEPADKGHHWSSSKLDIHSNLMKAFAKKGGAQRRKIKTIMAPIIQADTVCVRRECIPKGLCMYPNEDPEKLVKEHLDVDIIQMALAVSAKAIGAFVVRHEDAEPGGVAENVGIVLDRVEVMALRFRNNTSTRHKADLTSTTLH